MPEFRFLRTQDALYVGEVEVEDDGGGDWVVPVEFVSQVSLSSLRRALVNSADHFGVKADGYDVATSLTEVFGRLYVSPAAAEDFDVEYSDRLDSTIVVMPNGQTAIDVTVAIHGINLDEDEFAPVLAPLLGRHNAPLLEVAVHASGNQGVCLFRIGFGPRGATVGDALAIGDSVAALISQLRDGEMTADGTLGLLRAGRGDLLIGLPESRWLEVKSQGFDLGSGDAAKIELGQDVARFANGDTDSLLVIGFRTDKAHGDEVISKMTPALSKFSASRYHQTIDARVHPGVLGLSVEQFEVPLRSGGTGYLLAILIPAQPEESKPFLVHGAIAGGKVEGAFISVVQRRGEHSVPITAPAIHAALAAGRALLRRGELPRSLTNEQPRSETARPRVSSPSSTPRLARRARQQRRR